MLRLLNGLTFPTSGEVHYRGTPVSELSLPLFRSKVVMLSQEPILSGGTVYESIVAPFAFASNRSKNPSEDQIKQLLLRLDLSVDMLKQHTKKLSGGEKQRVALIRAVVIDPEVLLIDEPTSALDPLSEQRVIDVLASLRDRVSLIVVSHSSRLLDFADEIILMSNGTVVDRLKSIDEAQFRRFLEARKVTDG